MFRARKEWPEENRKTRCPNWGKNAKPLFLGSLAARCMHLEKSDPHDLFLVPVPGVQSSHPAQSFFSELEAPTSSFWAFEGTLVPESQASIHLCVCPPSIDLVLDDMRGLQNVG